MKLEEIFAKYNKTDLLSMKVDSLGRDTLRTYQATWLSWYRGYVRSFHKYSLYNGQKRIPMRRRTAGMAKTICEDWATLLINEKTDIVISDPKTQTAVEDIFKNNDFWQEANQGLEKAFALGLGAFVVRVDNIEFDSDTGEIASKDAAAVKIEFVNGTKIYPFTIDNREISECAFVTRRGKKISISMHLIGEDGNYEIHNISGTVNNTGNITYDESTDAYTFYTHSPRKWFFPIKPNIANNIDPDSPLGVSVFANAIDQLETVDLIFDSFGSEYQLGRKRVYASAEAVTIDEGGEKRPTFDPNDVAFYTFPKGTTINGDDKPYVQESTGELRAEAFEKGLNVALNILSTKVGLGENRYRYEAGGIATATQVISENSAMFRTVKRHEILIESVFIGLIETILYAANTFTNASVNEKAEITVTFDDSIIEDKAAERLQDMQEVSQGLMADWEYRMKYHGESEEQAKAWAKNKAASQPKITDLFKPPTATEDA